MIIQKRFELNFHIFFEHDRTQTVFQRRYVIVHSKDRRSNNLNKSKR